MIRVTFLIFYILSFCANKITTQKISLTSSPQNKIQTSISASAKLTTAQTDIRGSIPNNQPTSTPSKEENEVNCHWSPKIICQNNKLDLSSIGCNETNDIVKQNYVKSKTNKHSRRNSSHASCNSKIFTRDINCKICEEYENWSSWSECCLNSTCYLGGETDMTFSKFRKIRSRRLHSECRTTFDIDQSCLFELNYKICGGNISGRALPQDPDIKNDNPDASMLSVLTKAAIFTVAAVVLLGLFGFAGVRVLKTLYIRPNSSSTRRVRGIQTNTQYSNGGYRSDSQTSNHLDPVLILNTRRMVPHINRLSVIQEEDAQSVNVQESEIIEEENDILLTESNSTKLDGNAALNYMDDIITQIEDDERTLSLDNEDYCTSVSRKESLKMYNELGWNPNVRVTNTVPDRFEKLRTWESNKALLDSDLSLASASLLRSKSKMSSIISTGTSDERIYSDDDLEGDRYSLNDINDCDNIINQRQYLSEPDLNKYRNLVPDISEVLNESEYDEFENGNYV